MLNLFSKRNKANEDSTGLIYDELPERLRIQVTQIWDTVAQSVTEVMVHRDFNIFYRVAQKALCKEFGVYRLTNDSRTAHEDVWNYFLNEADVSKCLDVIKVVFNCFCEWGKGDVFGCNYHLEDEIRNAVDEMNQRLREHRIGFEFSEGRFTRIDSFFLHSQAVSPALALLNEPYLNGANTEFAKAQEHYRHGRYTETINECLKAFESTMKAICHKRNWPYEQNHTAKPLLNICERNGLFPPFLMDSLSNLCSAMMNVATVRNKMTGHGQGVQPVHVDIDTAVYVLNSTAANILYLVSCEIKLR